MLVALAGGVGAAKFLSGLAAVVPEEEITIIANTGDDSIFYGLHVSPDMDIVAYTLAGIVDLDKGWGISNETFSCLAALGALGQETWFQLGDRDLATHIHRTDLLNRGYTLAEATAEITRALGLSVQILPMSNQQVATHIETPAGLLPFQQYMVQRRAADRVAGVRFVGAEEALPAPGVLEALSSADGVIVCPSNPIISIGTILAVPGIRPAVRDTAAPVVAISPIVGGSALKGPADRMMRDLGYEPSAFGVAALYRDFCDAFVIDRVDAALAPRIEALGMRVVIAGTIMSGPEQKRALAQTALSELRL